MISFRPKIDFSAICALISLLVLYQIFLVYATENEPCLYIESINITDGYQLPNGSYVHDNIMYPPHLFGVFTDDNDKQSFGPHLRGCICNIKSCTRLCCLPGSVLDSETKECRALPIDKKSYSINITMSSNSYQEVNLFDKFHIFYELSCEDSNEYYVEVPPWKMLPNGNIEEVASKNILTTNNYCLTSQAVNGDSTGRALNAYVCVAISQEEKNFQFIMAIVSLLSVPFMLVTVIVYAAIPELRTLHGKCLCCHLVCVIIYNCTFAYMKLKVNIKTDVFCIVIAYVSYYSVLAAFFWLNVMSFDLWWNFRGTKVVSKSNHTKRLLFYSLYSWGMPLAFTVFATILEHIPSLPDILKVGFADGMGCFIASDRWIQLLYLYGPTAIIIIANGVMFIMIAVKIHRVQKEMKRIMSGRESQKSLEKEKARNGLFFKLFLVMGVSWSMEIVSWFIGERLRWFFYVTDFCNVLMGVIIFFLFVFKKKIKDLIVKRYRSARGLSNTSASTRSRTNNSTEESLL